MHRRIDMNKEDKKEITLGTTVKAVITGYVCYGILFGFLAFVVAVCIRWCLNILPNVNKRVVSITIPLIALFFFYFIARGICHLSVHDVFKKCKTNPENLPKAFSRLKIFIMCVVAVLVVYSIGNIMINFNNDEQSIIISSYTYKALYSEEFAAKLTNDMTSDFEEEKINAIISNSILELGIVISLFSVIPLQKKLITEQNEF
jgi:hypothetical protein